MDVDNKTCLTDKSLLTDWGDGTIDSEYTHNYQPNDGDDCNYRIVTTGFLENASGSLTGNTEYIVAVEQIRPDIVHAGGLFCGYENVTTENLFLPETSSMTDMNHMFAYCKSLTTLDLNSFDTSNVTDMEQMFIGCEKLTSLNVSSFNTSNVTDMTDMFSYCYKLTSLDVSSFDTSKVTNMDGMFTYCSTLTSLDLSNFDTSNVTGMYCMFSACNALESLNLSNFNVSETTNVDAMFQDCDNLHTIRLDNCSNETIDKIINSTKFPTGTTTVARVIFCKQENAAGLTAPTNWVFEYID